MPKIVVGPINKGLKDDVTAFNIDDDNFPFLVNAYQWRGRIKRKRGTALLGRLRRFIGTTDGAGNLVVTITPVPIPTGISFFTIGTDIFTDPGTTADPATQTLLTNSTGTGTLNRVTGVLTITGSQPVTSVIYYPTLPVMGLEDLILQGNQFPGTLAFDTHYSYNILKISPYAIYDVSFYKNPATATYPAYVRKTTSTPLIWNGQDYQQFWTVNYQAALWATNGINIPFVNTNVGMQFKPIVTTTVTAVGPPAIVTLNIAAHGLVVGDFVFVNEVSSQPVATSINFQTGYVIAVIDVNNVSVEFPNATITTNGAGGIAQYLTSNSDATKDCIRFYDGDPTDGNPTSPTLSGTNGWVNFTPPLSREAFSIAELPAAQYYLVTARMIVPYKDRLLFFGPVVQTSSAGSQRYLQDTVIYSQNGTPYYTASFTGDPSLSTTVFTPILIPDNQTAAPNAWWEDQTGFGGYISAGVDQAINTTALNEDVLITGFDTQQTRLVYTGNDLVPFVFYTINSELGSSSVFSIINFDKAIFTRGSRGYITTSQGDCQRVDLDIPDHVFQVNLTENGVERYCSQRDFINEWAYITFPSNQTIHKFPTRTLQFNYRDNSWAVFEEAYTTYGSFRRQTGFIWSTVGQTFATWSAWNQPWNAGSSTLLQPEVIAGNQQGFILFRDVGTDEGNSLTIQNVVGNTISSPSHCLNNNDYITISGVLGTISGEVNNKIFSVYGVTRDTFKINPSISAGTYLGGGLIKRMYVPYIQTRQFPSMWGMSRKTRIGVQQYLFTTTAISQVQLLIFLSQNEDSPYNEGGIPPSSNILNNSLIYSTVLYTCPESTNLGLTAKNINLNMVTAQAQASTWHRVSTSLLGDTVQLGFTLSDSQMRTLDSTSTPRIITGIVLGTTTVITVTNNFSANQLVKILGVLGTIQLNGNVYNILDASSTDITIDVDSTTFGAYISGGTATLVGAITQFAEIELHGFILDVTPSQVLA